MRGGGATLMVGHVSRQRLAARDDDASSRI